MLSNALLRLARYRDAEAALETAARWPDVSPVWQARHSALRAMVVRYTENRAQAAEFARTALAAGRELGDPVAAAYALHVQAVQQFDNDDLRASCRLTDEALAVAERDLRLADLRLLLLYNRVHLATELGYFEEAWDLARETLAHSELSGSPRLGTLRGNAASVAYEFGRWDEAMAELDAATEVDRDSDTEHQCTRVLIAGHRDERPKASRDLAALQSSVGGFAPPAWDKSVTASNIVAVAVLEIERSGEPGRAVRLLAQWFESGQEDRPLPFSTGHSRALCACAWRSGTSRGLGRRRM